MSDVYRVFEHLRVLSLPSMALPDSLMKWAEIGGRVAELACPDLPIWRTMKGAIAVYEMAHGLSRLCGPFSNSISALKQFENIQSLVRDIPFSDHMPDYVNGTSVFQFKKLRHVITEEKTAEAVKESALAVAVDMSRDTATKPFSQGEMDEAVSAVRDILFSDNSDHRQEVAKQFSDSKAFTFLMSIVASILAAYLCFWGPRLSKEFEISSRSAPAIEYAMYSTDKPHIGVIRREGARVYERPDKRSLPVHKFIEGEFVALMWDRQRGWRKVAYEVDLGTMKALKVGWIQDSDYDRTKIPVKSIFLRLYVEQ